MFDMARESYKIAEKKAQELLTEISPMLGMLDTDKVVALVQDKTKYKVKVYRADFSELGIDGIENLGGFISVIKKKESSSDGIAAIYLNSKNSPQMMRFSLMHEVGHLMTMDLEKLKVGHALASPHISANIYYLNEEKIGNDKFLEDEQAANIFALSILMPEDKFLTACKQFAIEDLAGIFGVTPEAVLSRCYMLMSENG